MRKIVYNPLVGDTQTHILQYQTPDGQAMQEECGDLIDTQKRARTLFREGFPNSFKILTITTQISVFEP
ncbi:hypothetical protein, partial [Streptococcus pneumoniae]|uniref:hypothetical protein n=1 Tax=Streptococcus pneumoniae TaxID=1313 RepID=UPI001E59B8FC